MQGYHDEFGLYPKRLGSWRDFMYLFRNRFMEIQFAHLKCIIQLFIHRVVHPSP